MASTSSSPQGVSKLIGDLPSRGFFSCTVASSNLGRMRDYICLHNTSPPEDQDIKTDQQNILIRSLMLKAFNPKDGKGVAALEPSRKRAGEKNLDGRGKRAAKVSSTKGAASNTETQSKDFQHLTVEKLRVLLKAKGLSLKGKKDDLIARLRSADG